MILESEQREKERLNLALRASRIGIWEWNIVKNTLIWDPRMYELYGVDPHTSEDIYEMWANALHPEDRARAEAEVGAAVSGDATFDTDFRIVLPGNRVRHIRGLGEVVFDDDGNALRMIGANWDITRRRNNEELIESSLKKVQQANRRLEEFASSVSHDLQAPLRHIKAFTEMISVKLHNTDGYEDEGEIAFVQKGVERMTKLITDILAYSRSGGQVLDIRRVDIAKLVRHCEANLAMDIRAKEAMLTVGKMPSIIFGDEIQLETLLQNLLSNALKYSQEGERPWVRIGYEETDAHHVFHVADNGIGIPEGKREQVFRAFQRLHPVSKFEGSGIGLSTCLRVAQAHYGNMWIESGEGGGSVVYFSIAKDLPQNYFSKLSENLS